MKTTGSVLIVAPGKYPAKGALPPLGESSSLLRATIAGEDAALDLAQRRDVTRVVVLGAGESPEDSGLARIIRIIRPDVAVEHPAPDPRSAPAPVKPARTAPVQDRTDGLGSACRVIAFPGAALPS